MSTLREIIEAQKRLADSVFDQSAALNKQTVVLDRLSISFERVGNTFERMIPSLDQLRRDVYDVKNDREMDSAKIDLALGKLNTDLAVLVDNVKDAQGDVRTLTREVTGTHLAPPREPRKPAVVSVIEAFERLPTTTKFIVFILVLAAALSGWLTHIIGG